MPTTTARKRPRPGELVTRQVADVLEVILPDTVPPLTNGALEGLRLAHEAFLEKIAAELQKSESKGIVQPNELEDILCRLGYANLAKEAKTKMKETESTVLDSKTKLNKKKKSQFWTTDMEAEQERLLAQSRTTMVGKNKDPR